jgi:hypothetical protein
MKVKSRVYYGRSINIEMSHKYLNFRPWVEPDACYIIHHLCSDFTVGVARSSRWRQTKLGEIRCKFEGNLLVLSSHHQSLHIDDKSASLINEHCILVRNASTTADNSLHRTLMSITIYSWGECLEHIICRENVRLDKWKASRRCHKCQGDRKYTWRRTCGKFSTSF